MTKKNSTYKNGRPPKVLTAEAVNQHFKTIYLDEQANYPDYDQFLNERLYFITANFKAGAVGVGQSAQIGRNGQVTARPAALKEFGKLYFAISKRLLGKNLGRKRRYQPLTYAFVDFEASKERTTLDVATREMPHVHALMLVRPQHRTQFDELLKIVELMKPTSMGSLLTVPFQSSKQSVEELIGYCMKGYVRSRNDQDQEDLWQLYPPVLVEKRKKKRKKRKPVLLMD